MRRRAEPSVRSVRPGRAEVHRGVASRLRLSPVSRVLTQRLSSAHEHNPINKSHAVTFICILPLACRAQQCPCLRNCFAQNVAKVNKYKISDRITSATEYCVQCECVSVCRATSVSANISHLYRPCTIMNELKDHSRISFQLFSREMIDFHLCYCTIRSHRCSSVGPRRVPWFAHSDSLDSSCSSRSFSL